MPEENPPEVGTKELMELIQGLKELALIGKLANADGKIDMADLSLLPVLLSKQKVLVDAFTGLGNLSLEAKDLSFDEAAEVVQSLLDCAKEVAKA